jgi:hypothetical protein
MKKNIKLLSLSFATLLACGLLLTACIEPPYSFSENAMHLGAMNKTQLMAEFRRLGESPLAPGPIPYGSAQVKAGLMGLQNIAMLGEFQQDIAHALVWAGKDFSRNAGVQGCDSSHEHSVYRLTNRFVGAFKFVEKLEGGGTGLVYYDSESWGDGNPVIAVDYASITPTMGFMRNEMRVFGADPKDPAKLTYLGIMWANVLGLKVPIAFFIPDGAIADDCREEF